MLDCHPTTENQKIELMERLYFEQGRDKRDHPMHGSYTGLYRQHVQSQDAGQ
jgi:mRNA-degrading endonuclease YafQ of YafQ-DinJ toxin-antitoxin module